MHVTTRQLRMFLSLADTGSVSRAARACHVTQPTASGQLAEISRAVGVPLYEVVGRKVHLTDAGEDLARTAREMAEAWAAFAQRMDATRGLLRGRLRVSVVTTAKAFVPRLLGGFCNEHPEIEISLEILNRDGVVQRLRDNRDDLYVMSMPPRDVALDDRILMDNPLVVIAGPRHPMSARKRIPLADLQHERFILRERGSGTRMAVDAHFRRRRFRPDVRLELGSNEAIREAVGGGLGLGILSAHALKARDRPKDVRVLSVQGFPLSSKWHVVRPRGRHPSPVAAAFERHLFMNAGR